jgi:hypothetical protein
MSGGYGNAALLSSAGNSKSRQCWITESPHSSPLCWGGSTDGRRYYRDHHHTGGDVGGVGLSAAWSTENMPTTSATHLLPLNATDCKCTRGAPGVKADLTSVKLDDSKGSVWQRFTRHPLYTEWAEGRCGPKVNTDPCSCKTTGDLAVPFVQCADGRITRLDMGTQSGPGLLPRGGIPLALMDLTGRTYLRFYGSYIIGSVAATPIEYPSLKGNGPAGPAPGWRAGPKRLTGPPIGPIRRPGSKKKK